METCTKPAKGKFMPRLPTGTVTFLFTNIEGSTTDRGGFRRRGKLHQAQERLATARMLYRKMDMRFWLEEAEAETGAVR